MPAPRPSRNLAALAALLWAAGVAAAGAALPPDLALTALWAAAALGPAAGLLLARASGRGDPATADLERRLRALEAGSPRRGRPDRRGAAAAGEGLPPAARPAAPPQARPAAPSAAVARPAAPRPAPPSAPPSGPGSAEQPDLPIAGADETAPWPDLVRALDFPRDEADEAGMAALRSALRDPLAARLLQAAEDVLSILAAHGLHMEDLRPDPPDPAAWLAYAGGARGAAIDGIGAVRDAAALEAARGLLRADPVLRDAAMVFASRWGLLAPRAAAAFPDGAALAALADTRSGRAFMLLVRALGAFD